MMIATMAIIIFMPMSVYAAEAVTAFGSEEYSAETNGEVFPIGIYIRSDDMIGDYHVELRYDNARLRYVEGATAERDGVLVVDGTSDGERVKVFLYFEAISGGDAGIVFENALVYTLDEEHVLMDAEELAYAPIHIAGDDVVGVSFLERLDELRNPPIEAEENIEEDVSTESIEQDNKDVAEAERVEETDTTHDSKYDTASAVYEQSKNIEVQDRKEKMISVFIILVAVSVILVLAVFIGVSVSGRRKRIEEEDVEAEAHFPFEFDTVPDHKANNEAWAKVIRHDLDVKENAGQDISQVQFKELSAKSKFDDIEFVNIDLDDDIIEFIDDDTED